MSPVQTFTAPQGRFVVRHTFLDFANSGDDEISRIKRANSDSALYDTMGKDMCASSEGGNVADVADFDGDGDDITLCGLSDYETEAVEEESSENSDSEYDQSGGKSVVESPCSKVEEPTLSVFQKQLEDLATENARLAKENSTLKNRALPVPWADEPVVPSPGPSQTPMFHPAMLQAQAMFHPSMYQMMMANQMGCVFPAMANNQFSAPHLNQTAEEAPARRRRSRVARAGQNAVAQDTSRSARPLDAILPDPVKPMAELASGKARSTVMLRNMPNNYSRTMLLELLDCEGFAGQYDFLYLPMDFHSRASLGYAFINFTTNDAALVFWNIFDGYSNWAIPSRKVSGVSWSGPHQGLEAHVDRYRNSPVMAETVPDEYKPVLFVNSTRVPFPSPTRRIRAPRVR